MIVAGIGMRQGAPAQEIVHLVQYALLTANLPIERLAALATVEDRASERGFKEAAGLLNLPQISVPVSDMQRVAVGIRSHSARIEALYGVGSVAEGVALAAAGQRPRLLQVRIDSLRVTCALAEGEPA